MTAGIYRIRNRVTGDAYIGSSRTVEYRVKGHQKRLALGNHENKNLRAAWSEYGPAAFSFGFLEVTDATDDALEEAERRWVTRYSGQLYNVRIRPARARPDAVTLLRRGIGDPEEVRRAREASVFWARYLKQRRRQRRGK